MQDATMQGIIIIRRYIFNVIYWYLVCISTSRLLKYNIQVTHHNKIVCNEVSRAVLNLQMKIFFF